MRITVQELMEKSGVKFGTSGARGLAVELTDFVGYTYTRGFLQYLVSIGDLKSPASDVAVAGDLRPSTGRIMESVCRAIEDFGGRPVVCGRVPSPVVALHGFAHGIPAVMVTGSHIPEDRNGIKFNKCAGEILKDDEPGVRLQSVEIPDALFTAAGAFARPRDEERCLDSTARDAYVRRYLEFFGLGAIRGLRLGVYQHSAVGREMLVEILRGLGAETTPLGFSDKFIPVDTEAIRPEDVRQARDWAANGRFDAIVSTDGDSDRPLIADEKGEWLRGDVAGVLCARFLGADSVSTPVSCNTVVEKCGWFRQVRRTCIGSPYVVSSMIEASAAGARCVVGYEANGGFLLNSDVTLGGRTLRALPTRDALVLLISVLLLARREGGTLSQLVASLPARFTASELLRNCPVEKSQAILKRFTTGSDAGDKAALDAVFGDALGSAAAIDRTDGIRVTLTSGEVVHFRPSGNAPEFRAYSEAAAPGRAVELARLCLERISRL